MNVDVLWCTNLPSYRRETRFPERWICFCDLFPSIFHPKLRKRRWSSPMPQLLMMVRIPDPRRSINLKRWMKEIEIFSTQTWWVLWMLREFCRKNAWKYVELYIIFFTLFAKLLQKVSYRFKKKQELQLHHLIASKNHLIASKNHLIASKNHLIASKNHLIASKNYLIASKNRLIASKNHLVAPKNHVIAPKSYLIASKNYLIASKNHYSLKKPPYSLKKPPYSLKKPPYSFKKLPYSLKKPPYSLKKPPHSFKKPPYSLKKLPYSLKKPPYSLKKPPDSLKNHLFFFWFFSRVWYRDLFDAGGTGFDLSGLRTLRILRITRLVSWSRSFMVFVRIEFWWAAKRCFFLLVFFCWAR